MLLSETSPAAEEGSRRFDTFRAESRSAGRARSQTSYCSSPSLKRETGRPPTRIRRLSAIVPTGMPKSLARSRSIETWTSGLRSESVVSMSAIPPAFFNSAASWSA
jgi:hypothetical protein